MIPCNVFQEIDREDTEMYLHSLIKLVAYAKLFSHEDPLPLAAAHLACKINRFVSSSLQDSTLKNIIVLS